MHLIENFKEDLAQMRTIISESSGPSVKSWLSVLRPSVFLKLLKLAISQHISPAQVGLAVGVGVCVGMTPLFGFHLLLCILLGSAFRLNKLVMYLAANISNPVLIPLIVYAEFQLGSLISSGQFESISIEVVNRGVGSWFYQVLTGSLVLGPLVGILLGFGVYFFMIASRARENTETVYDNIRIEIFKAFRKHSRFFAGYVNGKLRFDPVYRDALAVVPKEASILDVGGGVGLFCIYHHLFHLGNPVSKKIVVDWDDERVDLGKKVSNENAWPIRYQSKNAFSDEISGHFDSILLFDVLHYQKKPQQDQLIMELFKNLNPEGVLLIREMNSKHQIKNFFTWLLEKLSIGLSFTKATEVSSRSVNEYVEILVGLGMEVDWQPCARGVFFSNYLIVARKLSS